jgi:hypothetical protein
MSKLSRDDIESFSYSESAADSSSLMKFKKSSKKRARSRVLIPWSIHPVVYSDPERGSELSDVSDVQLYHAAEDRVELLCREAQSFLNESFLCRAFIKLS